MIPPSKSYDDITIWGDRGRRPCHFGLFTFCARTPKIFLVKVQKVKKNRFFFFTQKSDFCTQKSDFFASIFFSVFSQILYFP